MINEKIIRNLLKAKKHQDVINIIEHNVDITSFIVLRGKLFTIYIPKKLEGLSPALVCHTDTVFDIKPYRRTIFRYKNCLYSNSDGNGLGADDRAGCYILLETMKTYPNKFIFCFFDEEESGCKGSSSFDATMIVHLISLWIGFDRKGSKNIATYSYNNKSLMKQIKNKLFPDYKIVGGTSTDVTNLSQQTDIACINFSVGYYNEHTPKEKLNLKELIKVFSVFPILINLKSNYIVDDVSCNSPFYEKYDFYEGRYDRKNKKEIRSLQDYEEDQFDTFHCQICNEEYFRYEKINNMCCGKEMIKLSNSGGLY